ncbi:MAG: hypothetical protein IKN04_09025 [Clostridia bacterium]|nr:hypothetical protein [Clostridia bacterium]
MPIVNYVREHIRFMEYATDEHLTGSERLLWYALMHIMNQRAQGNVWPDEFIRVSNDRLLSYCPMKFDTMANARNSLKQRGLIEFTKGEKNKLSPAYRMIYFYPQYAAPETERDGESYPKNSDNMGGNMGYNMGCNMGYNMGGNMGDISINYTDMETVPQMKPGEIHTQDGYYGEYTTSRARAQGYIGTDGEMHPSRYDSAWAISKRARGAVAQRLIDSFPGEPLPYDEHARLMEVMENGVAPEAIEDIAKSCEQRKSIFIEIMVYAKKYGFTEEARIMRECLYAMNGNQAAAQAMYRMRMHDKEAD